MSHFLQGRLRDCGQRPPLSDDFWVEHHLNQRTFTSRERCQ